VEYRNSGFNRFIYDDLATSYKNIVNFGPVTLEFKKGKYVHPSSISSLATSKACEDQYGVLWGDMYSVVFQLFAEGVTAMPRGRHAGLCHAFLVFVYDHRNATER